jgi:hypothetical protein
MLIVNYHPKHGKAIPDACMGEFAISIYSKANKRSLQNKHFAASVGSKQVIFALLDGLAQKTFQPENIQFRYYGKVLELDKKNQFINPPPDLVREEAKSKVKKNKSTFNIHAVVTNDDDF